MPHSVYISRLFSVYLLPSMWICIGLPILEMQDLKMLGTKIEGTKQLLFLLCIYRVLVRKAVIWCRPTMFIGFVPRVLMFFFWLVCVCRVIMKITIIVIVNENAHSQMNSSWKHFALFRAFIFHVLHFHVLHFRVPSFLRLVFSAPSCMVFSFQCAFLNLPHSYFIKVSFKWNK